MTLHGCLLHAGGSTSHSIQTPTVGSLAVYRGCGMLQILYLEHATHGTWHHSITQSLKLAAETRGLRSQTRPTAVDLVEHASNAWAWAPASRQHAGGRACQLALAPPLQLYVLDLLQRRTMVDA
eukprot:SAG25_NODE_5988_length_599_cov_0.820000_1_plen_124_part_00